MFPLEPDMVLLLLDILRRFQRLLVNARVDGVGRNEKSTSAVFRTGIQEMDNRNKLCGGRKRCRWMRKENIQSVQEY
jgi:hypothetical protein